MKYRIPRILLSLTVVVVILGALNRLLSVFEELPKILIGYGQVVLDSRWVQAGLARLLNASPDMQLLLAVIAILLILRMFGNVLNEVSRLGFRLESRWKFGAFVRIETSYDPQSGMVKHEIIGAPEEIAKFYRKFPDKETFEKALAPKRRESRLMAFLLEPFSKSKAVPEPEEA